MYCPNCGIEAEDSKFCPSCGVLVQEKAEVEERQVANPTANPEQLAASTFEPEKETKSISAPPQVDLEADSVLIPEAPKKFAKLRNLSKEKKALLAVTLLIVIILLAPIIFTLNSNEANESERWIVQNEYAEFYGGVSMNMTFDDYIASYNAAVMDLKEKEGLEKYNSREVGRNMAKLNTISRSDFEEVSQWDDGIVNYGMGYNKRGLTGGLGGGDASLRIGVDKKTGYVQFVGLDVTDDIFNGSDYWSYEIPYYIFNFIDDEKYVDMFNSIDEGRGFVYKNDTVYAKEKAPRKTKEGYTIEYMVFACTKDCVAYKAFDLMFAS